MVAGPYPRGLGPYGIGMASLAGAAGMMLAHPSAGIVRRSDDDPYQRPSLRPRTLPEGECAYRAVGSKRSRRRQRGKAKAEAR